MSKQELQQYMPVTRIEQTFLTWNEQRYSVRGAPPNVFDAWIRQVVDSIKNVDTTEWEPFHRWQVINAALDGKLLKLSNEPETGTFFLQVTLSSEEKSSEQKVG